jgi:hypothetical protein
MRAKYSIALALLLTAQVVRAGCPPALVTVAESVSRLRAVPAPFAPPCRFVAAGALRAELDRKLRADLPLAPERFLEVLFRLALVDDAPTIVYPRLLDFYATQVLAYYEPARNEMVLLEGPAAQQVSAQLVWAHELGHAAQERRFKLPSRLYLLADNADAQRAASAIAEGDALLTMLAVAGGGADLGGLAEATLAGAAAAQPDVDGVPEYFVADLLFPYTEGLRAVLREYRRGGFAAIDALLAAPPASTAALLHPDRPAPGPALGDTVLPPVPPGWESVVSDTLGEWGLRFWLARRLGEETARRLAHTWDGDRLRLVAREGEWALVWRLRCRDEAGRVTLEAGLRGVLPGLLTRLGGNAPPPMLWHPAGRELEIRANWPAAPAAR